ncbi:hypothetical protein C8F01DRAFT_1146644 [Mycena amicta]|nr:hypothetical protein C8F01DRAFT_1150535 [Mycena amicta]KAJ7059282.1 hypothetical protein C8F01DRAFT_1146644 [Mycena amicta]
MHPPFFSSHSPCRPLIVFAVARVLPHLPPICPLPLILSTIRRLRFRGFVDPAVGESIDTIGSSPSPTDPLPPLTSLWSKMLASPKRRNFIFLHPPGSSTGSLFTPLSSSLSKCRSLLCLLLFVISRWTRFCLDSFVVQCLTIVVVSSFRGICLFPLASGFPWVFALAPPSSTLEPRDSTSVIFPPPKGRGHRSPGRRHFSTSMFPPRVGFLSLLAHATYTSARSSTHTSETSCCIPTQLCHPAKALIFDIDFGRRVKRFNSRVKGLCANAPTTMLSVSRRS